MHRTAAGAASANRGEVGVEVAVLDIAPSGEEAGKTRQISLLQELQSLPSAPGTPPERRRRDDGWLDRWLDTCGDLARLQVTNPMLDAVIDEIDGRRIRIGDQWLSDFASCNYLGFDLDPEIMDAIEPQVRRWGTHPSWSRLAGAWHHAAAPAHVSYDNAGVPAGPGPPRPDPGRRWHRRHRSEVERAGSTYGR